MIFFIWYLIFIFLFWICNLIIKILIYISKIWILFELWNIISVQSILCLYITNFSLAVNQSSGVFEIEIKQMKFSISLILSKYFLRVFTVICFGCFIFKKTGFAFHSLRFFKVFLITFKNIFAFCFNKI